MFTEKFTQIKEQFTKPQPIDQAERLLNERFQHLGLTDQEIGVFGVDFLRGQMREKPLKNLKVAKSLASERAIEFKAEVIEILDHSEHFKEKLQGTLAYGALNITRELLNDP